MKWPLNAVHCWSAVFFHYWFYFYVEIKPLFSFLFFFAVTVYQACRHTSKLTWTDCEDGLIKDCCVCLSFFFFSSLHFYRHLKKELFLLLPCVPLSFPTKPAKNRPNRSFTFSLNGESDRLGGFCLQCRAIRIVYSSGFFCSISPAAELLNKQPSYKVMFALCCKNWFLHKSKNGLCRKHPPHVCFGRSVLSPCV